MNEQKLKMYIERYHNEQQNSEQIKALDDRRERLAYYAGWSADRMRCATEEDLVPVFAKLWTMGMWGNKASRVAKMVYDNGLDTLRTQLANLLWGSGALVSRWDGFREHIKWIGPSMMSELLGYVRPDQCMVYNSISVSALQALEMKEIPYHDYRLDGKGYHQVCAIAQSLSSALSGSLEREVDCLEVNYFLWEVAQWAEEVKPASPVTPVPNGASSHDSTAEFLHDDIKEKVAEIGEWLGFQSDTEVKVADGSVVDATWEATIGNLGRVIYVFEVQTKGSVDSLLMNLLKSKKNAAVQGVVAVSNTKQLYKIRKHAEDVDVLKGLRCWNYLEVLDTHAKLQAVNESINKLDLVPSGF